MQRAKRGSGMYLDGMRCRVDDGTNGLHVTLPEERVTILEPFSGAAISDPVDVTLNREHQINRLLTSEGE